ncbi:ABC transporter ATP-binding protein [Aeromicrobium sp. 9AM]|uniref:ABC transporter ATP-binding protein n=1 Tax=Aeromicrobium sp. 9AM TaxID=2653126 RepID=UPI0012F0E329|nr:ABC transporter ATP-binding protein [Aeromicrobium sp. 9AM]VXB14469.1 dipeptide ABC transporter (ATP-binding subunit) [Aeromicrobium sp. 9AM]
MTSDRLLSIEGLRVDLPSRSGSRERRTVIHDVTLSVDDGESVGLVGESGSGKSMTTKATMRLLPPGAKVSGGLTFRGESVLDYSRKELAAYRSRKVSMIYQDPRAHTNPLLTIGDFLVEGVVATGQMSRADALDQACALLVDVGVTDAERRMLQYPHQLSGGLLQRMMIVMALMPSPELILADEPTTALDVTVQSEVMAILAEQIRERSLGMLFITHDLDLAAAVTDTLAVMYAGVIVERGPSDEVYSKPRHPYTAALLKSRPSAVKVERLETIPGRPISAYEAGPGCVFAARCPFATEECREVRPALRQVGGRSVACHRAEDIASELFEGLSA